MDTFWLNNNNNEECILFFNGWGMDKNAVMDLEFDHFDVFMLNNYNPVDNFDLNLKKYSEVYIVAWSLGVWATAKTLDYSKINYKKTIAINGTQLPKDSEYGIAPAIFDLTLKTWNIENRTKFNRRVLGGKKEYDKLNKYLSSRPCNEQKDELASINNELTTNTPEIKFDKVIIGNRDLIFSPANQKKYWKNKADIIEMEIPHYPFANFKSWKQIIEL